MIDGQQRLTTLLVLLSVIRDKAEEDGFYELAAEINETMLVNRIKKVEEYFKLLPTQVNKDVFKRIIKNEVTDIDQNSGLVKCYNYFKNKLNDLTIDVERLKNEVLHNLSLVSIVLSLDDNPYLVFESLNAKGQPLTEADLIRNYLFMRIEPFEQEEMYKSYWLPMQTNLGGLLTEFIRHFLMGVNLNVKKNDVYVKLKQQADKTNLIDYLKDFTVFSTYYDKLLHPEKEANTKLDII